MTSTSKRVTAARRAATQQYEQASVDQDHLTSSFSKSHLLCFRNLVDTLEHNLLLLRVLNRFPSYAACLRAVAFRVEAACTAAFHCQPKGIRAAGLGRDPVQQTNGHVAAAGCLKNHPAAAT